TTTNPNYEEVSSGKTGHFETVQIEYDPRIISYEKLLDIFWRNIDPTDGKGQFCDKGEQYRSAIFYHNDEQKRLAEISKSRLEKNKSFPEPVVTLILPASDFYPAEDYHQHYYREKPLVYKFYRFTCGRDNRLETLWGTS
ncbi:MAG: peptide-methionine (S)-S-oxide reductase MsrA, partial [Gammaproteobacteria bacterium]